MDGLIEQLFSGDKKVSGKDHGHLFVGDFFSVNWIDQLDRFDLISEEKDPQSVVRVSQENVYGVPLHTKGSAFEFSLRPVVQDVEQAKQKAVSGNRFTY